MELKIKLDSARPFRQFTGHEFERAYPDDLHSIGARHNPNSEETDALWLLSCFAGVEESPHWQSPSIGRREKSSFFVPQFTF